MYFVVWILMKCLEHVFHSNCATLFCTLFLHEACLACFWKINTCKWGLVNPNWLASPRCVGGKGGKKNSKLLFVRGSHERWRESWSGLIQWKNRSTQKMKFPKRRKFAWQIFLASKIKFATKLAKNWVAVGKKTHAQKHTTINNEPKHGQSSSRLFSTLA